VSKSFRLPALIATALASLALCASAQAAIVTVGSPVLATTTSTPSTPAGNDTVIDTALPEPGASAISPITGVVVRWRITGFSGGPFYLRVLTPNGGTSYTGSGKSAGGVPVSLATQTFTTNLPIKAGQTIGVDNTAPSDAYGVTAAPGGTYAFANPLVIPEGSAGTVQIGATKNVEFTFNADVQPPPTIATIGPASGSIKGGTSVTITGTDLEGASAVSFGGVPATSFSVVSETQVTAVAPATTKPASLPVAVTTPAGTATGATTFSATACVVPKLEGKKLKASKKKLKAGDCKLGKVKKLKGVTVKTGKVKKQSPKPGKILAPGSKVNVKLG
jgi:hypothetical protein